MAIANNKVRTTISIEKDLKKDLEELAKLDNRSFNNLIINILKNYTDSHK